MKKTYIAPAIEMEYYNSVVMPIATSFRVEGSSNPISITDAEVGDSEDALVKGSNYSVWDDIWN